MEKHKIWLSSIFVLGVLIPVLFFTPAAALQHNPDQIYSNKTKRPTANTRVTATSVSTRESRFHSTSTIMDTIPSRESTTILKGTQGPSLVDTLDPEEAEFQPTLDALATKDSLVQAEKKKNPNGLCGKPAMVIPIGLVVLASIKKRSKNIYL
jgi:hypothetical protein